MRCLLKLMVDRCADWVAQGICIIQASEIKASGIKLSSTKISNG